MTAKSLAFLACRILALYVMYLGLKQTTLLGLDIENMINTGVLSFGRLTAITLLFFDIAAFLVFWFGANWLSGRMASDPDERFEAAPEVSGYLQLAVSILGLVTVIGTIPSIAFDLSYLLSDERHIRMGRLVATATQLAIGVLLIVGGRRISAIIKAGRNW